MKCHFESPFQQFFQGEAHQQSRQQQATTGRPKMILKYLADMVQDVARRIESPTLEPCVRSGAGQLWDAGKPADWRGEGNLLQGTL